MCTCAPRHWTTDASHHRSPRWRGGRLPPFVSLDAPWCADYGVVSGYNDDFPLRDHGGAFKGDEQVLPEKGIPTGRSRASAPVRDFNRNMFQC